MALKGRSHPLLPALLLVAALCGAGVATAAPAPWFWWISKRQVPGQVPAQVCAQHMPAQGWQQGAGPFDNAQCLPCTRAATTSRAMPGAARGVVVPPQPAAPGRTPTPAPAR